MNLIDLLKEKLKKTTTIQQRELLSRLIVKESNLTIETKKTEGGIRRVIKNVATPMKALKIIINTISKKSLHKYRVTKQLFELLKEKCYFKKENEKSILDLIIEELFKKTVITNLNKNLGGF